MARAKEQLYLVEFEATDAGAPTSPEQALELLQTLIVPSLDALAKDPHVRAGGVFVGARAGVCIVAAPSHDKVTDLVRSLPAWGVWQWTVTPLESLAHRAKLERHVVRGLKRGR